MYATHQAQLIMAILL